MLDDHPCYEHWLEWMRHLRVPESQSTLTTPSSSLQTSENDVNPETVSEGFGCPNFLTYRRETLSSLSSTYRLTVPSLLDPACKAAARG